MKTGVNKIQVQVHKNLVVRMIELIKKARGVLEIVINSMDISSTLDIDTLALASVFPQMAGISPKRSVIFDVIVDDVEVSFENNAMCFLASAHAKVMTLDGQ